MSNRQTDPVEAYRRAVNPYRCELIDEFEWPHLFADATGDYITTMEGQRFVDLIAEYGAATVGHRHPKMIATLTAALTSGSPFIVPIGLPDLAGRLAVRLCELAGPPLERTYFCTGGAEAIESAMKFAMAATRRQEFVSFTGGYHGLTLGALSLVGEDLWRAPLAHWVPGDRHRVPFGDVKALDKVLSNHEVAAVVVESIQGLGGVRDWDYDALRTVAERCSHYGALLIADEVLTGIGRTGRWFGFQHAGIEPDIAVTSKGLSGGIIPVAAVLMSRAVHESVYSSVERATVHSSTFEAHLLGMVAGLTVLDIIDEEKLVDRAAATGAQLREELLRLRMEEIGITGVRGKGMMLAFRVEGIDEPDAPDGAATCMDLLMEHGFLVYPAAHSPTWLKLTPPLNLAVELVASFVQALHESLLELAEYR